MSDYRTLTFDELNVDQQDEAIGLIRLDILSDLYKNAKEPLDERVYAAVQLARSTNIRFEDVDIINDWAYDLAGTLALDAYYIPDDGSMVVRI